ncbi:MAG: hypothetical protein GMKNLPBB_03192 [Myxococcota bacterium]|nr:hypothetical protein [Myxococcota bacterium]
MSATSPTPIRPAGRDNAPSPPARKVSTTPMGSPATVANAKRIDARQPMAAWRSATILTTTATARPTSPSAPNWEPPAKKARASARPPACASATNGIARKPGVTRQPRRQQRKSAMARTTTATAKWMTGSPSTPPATMASRGPAKPLASMSASPMEAAWNATPARERPARNSAAIPWTKTATANSTTASMWGRPARMAWVNARPRVRKSATPPAMEPSATRRQKRPRRKFAATARTTTATVRPMNFPPWAMNARWAWGPASGAEPSSATPRTPQKSPVPSPLARPAWSYAATALTTTATVRWTKALKPLARNAARAWEPAAARAPSPVLAICWVSPATPRLEHPPLNCAATT